MKTIEELKTEILKDRKQLEEEAFELYCKDKLKDGMSREAEAAKKHLKASRELEELTMEFLTERFEGYSNCSMESTKEVWIKKLQLNIN